MATRAPCDRVDNFAGFGEGSAHVQSEDRREDIRDRVRFWAEECDMLRGVHVLAEDLGGFGGIAAAALQVKPVTPPHACHHILGHIS